MTTPGDQPRQGLIASVLTYGAGDAVLKLVSLAALPLFSRSLGPVEYGRYVVALTLASMVQSLLLMGGDSALGRLWFASGDRAEQNSIAGTWLRFSLLVSLLGLAILLPLAPAIGHLVYLDDGLAPTLAALLLAPLAITSLLTQQVLRNRFQPRAFVALSLLQAGCFLVLGVMVVKLTNWGAAGLIAALIAAQVVVLPLRWWHLRDCWTAPTSALWRKRLLAYGLPLVPVSIAAWLGSQADRILIQQWCAPEAVGWYGTAQTITFGFQALIVGAFAQAWSPHITRLHGEDPRAAAALAARMLPILTAGLLPVAVGLAWGAPWLIALVSGPAYAPAAAAMPPLALGLLAAGVGQVAALGISLSGHTGWFALIGWSTAVVGVGCNLLLLPSYGMEAAAWISSLVAWLTVGAQAAIGRRYWDLPFPLRRMLLLLSLGILAIAGACWRGEPTGWPLSSLLMTLVAALPAALALRSWRLAG